MKLAMGETDVKRVQETFNSAEKPATRAKVLREARLNKSFTHQVMQQTGACQIDDDVGVEHSGGYARLSKDLGDVDDIVFVCFGESLRDLRGNPNGLFDLQRPALNLLLERFTLIEGHYDENLAVICLADVVDIADVRVVERGGCFSLVDESLPCFGISRELGREELQGNRAVKLEVLGFVDHTHASPRQGARGFCSERRSDQRGKSQ
jgi:hypothetical protein